MMKVKSRTNVITNSSTEVFTYISDDAIAKVKSIVNSILSLSGSPKSCDDLIEIKGATNLSREELLDMYVDYEDSKDNPTDDDLQEFLEKEHEKALEYRQYPTLMNKLVFTPLVPEAESLCKALTNINSIFESDEFLC